MKPVMTMLEDREEYTFFQATSSAITPDVLLSDIYEVLVLLGIWKVACVMS